MDSDIVSRLKEFMEYNSLNSLTLSKTLGYKSSEKVSRLFRDEGNKAKPSYDIIYDISIKFEISVDWLITGRGSMLRDSKNPEETTIRDVPNVVPISPAEESIIYKMYKDEKEDWKAEKEKKEAQIDHLQSELRSMEKELATLKATHPQTSPPGVVIEEIHEVLGSPRIAKHADTKPHSSTCAPSAGSVQPHQENQ